MIHVRLPEAEAQELEARFRSTQDRKLRDRVQIVLLAHKGRKRQDIAADLRVNRRSVQRWLNSYCQGGLAALMPRKARGKEPGLPASLADEIKGWVIGGPASQGLDRANWTHEELADHLKKAKGVQTSRSAVQRFCSKIGIRLYRPTYRYVRGDPDKQAKAREDLAGLKNGAAEGELVLLSQDEARFQMVPTLAATLGVKGHRPVVGTRDCKDVLYAFAVLNLFDEIADLKSSVRNSLRYFQTVRSNLLTLINGRSKKTKQ